MDTRGREEVQPIRDGIHRIQLTATYVVNINEIHEEVWGMGKGCEINYIH